jgi:hypothetical protein
LTLEDIALVQQTLSEGVEVNTSAGKVGAEQTVVQTISKIKIPIDLATVNGHPMYTSCHAMYASDFHKLRALIYKALYDQANLCPDAILAVASSCPNDEHYELLYTLEVDGNARRRQPDMQFPSSKVVNYTVALRVCTGCVVPVATVNETQCLGVAVDANAQPTAVNEAIGDYTAEVFRSPQTRILANLVNGGTATSQPENTSYGFATFSVKKLNILKRL